MVIVIKSFKAKETGDLDHSPLNSAAFHNYKTKSLVKVEAKMW